MQILERHVRRLATPPRLEQLGPKGQERHEGGARDGRALLFECPGESQVANRYLDLSHHRHGCGDGEDGSKLWRSGARCVEPPHLARHPDALEMVRGSPWFL